MSAPLKRRDDTDVNMNLRKGLLYDISISNLNLAVFGSLPCVTKVNTAQALTAYSYNKTRKGNNGSVDHWTHALMALR